MVSSEVAPLAKTGGLADAVGSLPPALRALGDDVAAIVPRYRSIDLKGLRRVYDRIPVFLGPARYDTTLYLAHESFPVYLVDCPPLYDRRELYGEGGKDYADNPIRFAVLARAALAAARFLFKTEIFHCHDWQAGLVPAYLRTTFANDPTFLGAKTVFTIHDLEYQGLFPKTALAEVALDPAWFGPHGLEFFGKLSYIKGGIVFADALTTLSPTEAREMQTPELGFGLDGALAARAGVLTGILNGADAAEWDPATDLFLPARYSAADLSGKHICKEQLLAEFGLPARAVERPLLGMAPHLAREAGIGLVTEMAGSLASEDLYLAALGGGEPEGEDLFRGMAAAYPDRMAFRPSFDNGLAHRITAGADIFLLPGRYEPGGLTPVPLLKYGTVPVVRAVGGLNDTIDEGTGFKFEEPTALALRTAVQEAGRAFYQEELWKARMLRGMGRDFSWSRPAAAYSALYRRLLGQA